MLYVLIALAMISSDRPLLYIFAVSHVLMPRSNAAFRRGRASGSDRHQGIQRGSPKDMAPRMGLETRRPEAPSWMYCTFGAGMGAGTVEVMVGVFVRLNKCGVDR